MGGAQKLFGAPLAVLAHSTLITLPEAGRFPPPLPHSLRETHLINPRNAPRVIGEHGIVGGRVICHRVFSFPFSERRSQSYFPTGNERWVAPGVSSVRICSRWIGFKPR